jgi:hypothetical protein
VAQAMVQLRNNLNHKKANKNKKQSKPKTNKQTNK